VVQLLLMSQPTTDTHAAVVPRPPVIVVMGHVDHGKSSLLDYIRKANVVAGEAGGITQHIGAYEVVHEYEGAPRKITFLDTPGHAAFSAIRSRGAKVADIGILVVSAEDGVKAQTMEALRAIETAGIPYVVAMNKIDKPNADVNKTHASMIENGIYVEGYGGTTPWLPISAKTGQGISNLLDTLLLLTDVQELTGDHTAPVEGVVIEAHKDEKRGVAATIVIKNGTLRKGDYVVAGNAITPVRIMEDAHGKKLDEATFSAPVRLVGFDIQPEVGSTISVYPTKKDAEANRTIQPITNDFIWTKEMEGDERLLIPLIVRSDVIGSLEAIEGALATYTDRERVNVRIVAKGIGPITEADMNIARTSPLSRVIGFNVNADPTAASISLSKNIPVHTFTIIYELTQWLEDEVAKLTPKKKETQVVANAKVLKCFSATKSLKTIGCKVSEGILTVGTTVVLTRRGEYLGKGKIETLQAARQVVQSVMAPNECGLQIETSVEIADGDILELTRVVEV
jgi:translation initiation factor IF-2